MHFTLDIPEQNVAGLKKKIAQIATITQKLNLPSPQAVFGETVRVRVAGTSGPRLVVGQRVEIELPELKFSGFTFLAKIEAVTGGNLVFAFGGQADPAWSHISMRCEHCNTERRRSAVFAVRGPEGEIKIVGKSCLKDFTGHNVEGGLVRFSELLQNLINPPDCDDERAGSYTSTFNLQDVVSTALQLIDREGWVSRDQAEREGTQPTGSSTLYLLTKGGIIPDEYKARADAAIESLRASNVSPRETFKYNLKLLTNCDWVDFKKVGLAACIALEATRQIADKQMAVEKKDLNLRVGDKFEFTACFMSVHSFESDFGRCYIYKFSVDGNVLVWKTNKDLDINVDTKYKLSGKVKEFSEFKGQQQINISYCNVKDLK